MKRRKPKHGKITVYMAINAMTGHAYIGITDQYLSLRRSKHVWCAFKKNSQTHFHRAIRKYGASVFKWGVLILCDSYEEAKRQEIRMIEKLRPRYNMTKGGDGTVGFTVSREITERLAAQKRGRPGPWRGKKMPASFLEGGNRWRLSNEGRTHWRSAGRLGPKSIARKVVCLDDGKIYTSIREAAQSYNIDESMLVSVCRRGRHKTAKGLVFRYYGEHDGGIEEADRIREKVLASRQRTAEIARAARAGAAQCPG